MWYNIAIVWEDEGYRVTFDKVYEVDPEFDEQAFKRRALIDLALSSPSPDELKVQFGPVVQTSVNVLAYSCELDLDYTYDITCVEEVPYGDAPASGTDQGGEGSAGKSVKRISREVQQTGHTSGTASACVLNGGTMQPFEDRLSQGNRFMTENVPPVLYMPARDVTEENKNLVLKENTFMAARRMCESQVSPEKKGNAHNFNVKTTYCNVESAGYILPCYQTAITHGTKQYPAIGYACGAPYVWLNPPEKLDSYSGNMAVQRSAEKFAKLKFIHRFFMAITMLSLVAAFALCLLAPVLWYFMFVPVVLFALGLVLYKTACVRYYSYMNDFKPKWKQMMTNALNKIFKKNKFKELTEDEIGEFDHLDLEHGSDIKAHSIKRDLRDFYLTFVILFIVFAVLALVVSLA